LKTAPRFLWFCGFCGAVFAVLWFAVRFLLTPSYARISIGYVLSSRTRNWCYFDTVIVVSIGAFIELMDEQTVQAWLKEQHDRAETLAQQQAAAFQLQFDTLHAELQATRRLLQNRARGGGGQGLLLPLSMHLDVPKFNGDDLKRWISSSLQNTLP
nr:hypothetical protein [Tanacetum cinerariifolium]